MLKPMLCFSGSGRSTEVNARFAVKQLASDFLREEQTQWRQMVTCNFCACSDQSWWGCGVEVARSDRFHRCSDCAWAGKYPLMVSSSFLQYFPLSTSFSIRRLALFGRLSMILCNSGYAAGLNGRLVEGERNGASKKV